MKQTVFKIDRSSFLTALCVILAGAFIFGMFFGCSLIPDNQQEETLLQETLRIKLDSPVTAQGISQEEYIVTRVDIGVRAASSGGIIASFTWVPNDGDQTYDVPVPGAGDYVIEVTHTGENNGDEVEAFESATVSIVPSIISVVTIIPGQICVIKVEGAIDVSGSWSGSMLLTSPSSYSFTMTAEITQQGYDLGGSAALNEGYTSYTVDLKLLDTTITGKLIGIGGAYDIEIDATVNTEGTAMNGTVYIPASRFSGTISLTKS